MNYDNENAFEKADLIRMTSEDFSSQYQRAMAKIMEAISISQGEVVLCFSGGKDSALLLDMYCEIASAWMPNTMKDKPIKVAYADTTNETAAMRKYVPFFIKRCEEKYGVKIEMQVTKPANNDTFVTVLRREGIPFISKMVSSIIRKVTADLLEKDYTFNDIKDLHKIGSVQARDTLREMGLSNTTVLSLTGWSCKRNDFGREFILPKKYFPLLDLYRQTGIKLTEKCCIILKENPINALNYDYVMTGEQALESKMRESAWLKNGCTYQFWENGKNHLRSKPFGSVHPNVILQAIKRREVPICSDYGEIVETSPGCFGCTKAQRTGCALCGFGIKFEQDRFIRMQETEPQKIKFAFKPLSDGGAGYKELCEYANEYCGFKIKIPTVI